MAMWFAGFMMRINLGHLDGPANLLWFGGMGVICYVGYRMRFEVRYYQHMTAFTGFVMALVILFEPELRLSFSLRLRQAIAVSTSPIFT